MKNKYTRKLRIVATGDNFIVERRVLLWWTTAIFDNKGNPFYFRTVDDAEKAAHKHYTREIIKVL